MDVIVSEGKEYWWVRKTNKQGMRDEGHVEWLPWQGEFTKTRAKFTRDKAWTGPGGWQVFLCPPWKTSYWIIEYETSVAIIPKTSDPAEPESCVTLDMSPFLHPETPLASTFHFYPCHYKWAPSFWVGVGRMTLVFFIPSPHFTSKVNLLRFLPQWGIILPPNPQLLLITSQLGPNPYDYHSRAAWLCNTQYAALFSLLPITQEFHSTCAPSHPCLCSFSLSSYCYLSKGLRDYTSQKQPLTF